MEHMLILGVILLVLGPRRLPEVGNALGTAIRGFKEGLAGLEQKSRPEQLNAQLKAPVVSATAAPVTSSPVSAPLAEPVLAEDTPSA